MKRWWPHIRAALIFLHFAAVLSMCTPGGHKVLDRDRWESPSNQAQFEAWAARLSSIGIETSAQGLEDWLWNRANQYAQVRGLADGPFLPYVNTLHLHQGWSLFSNPQRRPALVVVDIHQPGPGYRPLYVQRSDQHTWRREMFDHNRLRKLFGRIGRRRSLGLYAPLGDWMARMAAADFPRADKLRIRLWRHETAAPGQRVDPDRGVFTNTRIIELAPLRRTDAIR